VTLLLLSYDNDPAAYYVAHGLEWYSESFYPLYRKGGPARYLYLANRLAAQRPDWIVSFSDTWYGILAQYLAARHGCKSLIDAYDNYESYIPWAKPLHWAWRRACRNATALTAAGPALLALMVQQRTIKNTAVVPMAADPIFRPMDREQCRAHFGLPSDIPLIGYCGSFYHNRGVQILYEVIRRLRRKVPEVRLVISGRWQGGVGVPDDLQNSVIKMGYLPDDEVPVLLNAMDVVLAVNRSSTFGRYSYPVKLYEAMRCGIPVISTDVDGAAWVLREHPECLVLPDNVAKMTECVRAALRWRRKQYLGPRDWEDSAKRFSDVLRGISETALGEGVLPLRGQDQSQGRVE
jgi:glycosyltransferase involved in cell wall biosynthesis